MKKSIVIYYSNKGSNKFLAYKIADNLKCNIEEIIPRLKAQFLLMMGLNFGNKPIKSNLNEFQRIILVGPIWMGKFVIPLKTFVNNYKTSIKELVFVTCCGSSFENKDKKFGHELVFTKVRELMNQKSTYCEAFPITLVIPENKKEDPNIVMETRLNNSNFSGEIKDRFDKFIKKMSAQ